MRIAWFVHALDSDLGHQIVQEFQGAATEGRFPVAPLITWAHPGMWEEHTVNQARLWALENPDGYILYTHTKGAFHEAIYDGVNLQRLWREKMIDRLLRAWPARIEELQDHDTSGVWMWEPDDAPGAFPNLIYPGNFWWARADYLATLPELPELTEENRGDAETWVGSNNPRAKWMIHDWVKVTEPLPVFDLG